MTQVTRYTVAPCRRTGIPLEAFECTWIDDRDYFAFYPLPSVYARL